MTLFLFQNARILHPERGQYAEGHVLVDGDQIIEVSDRPISARTAETLDLAGRVLMPGLIDAHVHAMISELDIGRLADIPPSLAALRAAPILSGMLDRGFTTVRDTGGADWGLREAVAIGAVRGPRLFICGRVISQTGGHVDYRARTFRGSLDCACCSGISLIGKVADGASSVLAAVREELRCGADHIKLSVSGGVASPNDPLESLQFTVAEIEAAVAAATDWGVYVSAHAYTPEAIRRALACGVRSIEHGNMIDAETAALARARDAFVVPTLVTYDCMGRFGAELGLPDSSRAKNEQILKAGLSSLEVVRQAGVNIGFGTDLLGPLHLHQGREFLIRAEVQTPAEVIRSATTVNAALLRMEGRLGVVAPGALADLIVVDGDPLADLSVFDAGGEAVPLVMKDGAVVKDRLRRFAA